MGAVPRPGHPPARRAYWLATDDGVVHRFGTEHTAHELPAGTGEVRSISGTLDGHGCYVLDDRGHLVGVGTARPDGDLRTLEAPLKPVDVATAPGGRGYWLLDSDGNVYAFAGAPYLGGVPQVTQVADVPVCLVPTPTGRGYWIVDRRGGICGFGDMWYGGPLADYIDVGGAGQAPVVGFAPAGHEKGYWILDGVGGVFALGDADYLGAPTEQGAVDAVALLGDGDGYLLIDARGAVLSYGEAISRGSLAGLGRRVVAAG